MTDRATSPDSQAAAIAALADLAGVEFSDLQAFLAARWNPGDASRALERIDSLRNEHARRAAAARRAMAAWPQRDVRQVIDQKLLAAPRWTKKRAFAWLAAERALSPDTVRNAYYAPSRDRDA